MRVKLMTRGAGPAGMLSPGTVIEVDDDTAARMVANHQATYTLEPVTPRAVERATVEGREVATGRGQRERKSSGPRVAEGWLDHSEG